LDKALSDYDFDSVTAPAFDASRSNSLAFRVLSQSTPACRAFVERQLQFKEPFEMDASELGAGVVSVKLQLLREPKKELSDAATLSDEEIEFHLALLQVACLLGVCLDC